MEFHDKITIPNLGKMAVMDSVRKAEDMVLSLQVASEPCSRKCDTCYRSYIGVAVLCMPTTLAR